LLLDKNQEKPGTEAYRALTDAQTSEGDLQVIDKVGVADGRILNHWIRAFSFIQRAASRKAAQVTRL
jgi:hypothetical protein